MRYELVKTLIRGKQSAKPVVTKGETKVTYHKKAIGYVFKDLENDGKLIAMDHIEAAEEVITHGATNVHVTATQVTLKDGSKMPSPYIKAKPQCTPVQDAAYVVDPDEFLAENKEVDVTENLGKALAKKSRKTGGSGRAKADPKFTKEALLAAIQAKKAVK